MNRSHPYMLDKFFDHRYFSVLDEPMTQGEVLKNSVLILQKITSPLLSFTTLLLSEKALHRRF